MIPAQLAVRFFDGTTLIWRIKGKRGAIETKSFSGASNEGFPLENGYIEFIRRCASKQNLVGGPDGRLIDSSYLTPAPTWDREEYDRLIGRFAKLEHSLVPLPLVSIEVQSRKVVFEDLTDPTNAGVVQHACSKTLLKTLCESVTLLGGFADRKTFVWYDGFRLEHDAQSNARQRCSEIAQLLVRAEGVVHAAWDAAPLEPRTGWTILCADRSAPYHRQQYYPFALPNDTTTLEEAMTRPEPSHEGLT